MRIGKSTKWSEKDHHADVYVSKGVWVEVGTQDFGLPEPTNKEEARETFARLSFEAEALLAIERVKAGRIHPNQLSDELKNYVPAVNGSEH